MTHEDKQLLLKVLCEGLPYGIMCDFAYNLGNPQKLLYVTPYDEKEQIHLDAKEYKFGNGSYGPSDFDIEEVKPYLRPMSNMTKRDMDELNQYVGEDRFIFEDGVISVHENFYQEGYLYSDHEDYVDIIDWLNAHHFDYRGLIEKGLALEAPQGMYKTE